MSKIYKVLIKLNTKKNKQTHKQPNYKIRTCKNDPWTRTTAGRIECGKEGVDRDGESNRGEMGTTKKILNNKFFFLKKGKRPE